jgi:hypothetical protein
MPRLRGKSRRGAAWYAARGRKMPNSDHLSDTEMPCADLPPDFDALLGPASYYDSFSHTEPQLEATQNNVLIIFTFFTENNLWTSLPSLEIIFWLLQRVEHLDI